MRLNPHLFSVLRVQFSTLMLHPGPNFDFIMRTMKAKQLRLTWVVNLWKVKSSVWCRAALGSSLRFASLLLRSASSVMPLTSQEILMRTETWLGHVKWRLALVIIRKGRKGEIQRVGKSSLWNSQCPFQVGSRHCSLIGDLEVTLCLLVSSIEMHHRKKHNFFPHLFNEQRIQLFWQCRLLSRCERRPVCGLYEVIYFRGVCWRCGRHGEGVARSGREGGREGKVSGDGRLSNYTTFCC